LSEEVITPRDLEAVVEEETKRLVAYYARILRRNILGHIYGAISWMARDTGIQPTIEMQANDLETGIEVRLRVYIDPETIDRIRDVVRRELSKRVEDAKTRLKVMKYILANELKASSGEVSGLLHDMRSSAAEDTREARGDRAKVRHKEGGPTAESS
jgi:hypothetical protein